MPTVVAAIDSSPSAEAVIARALEQARYAGADLHVVHVFHPPAAIYTMSGTYVFDEDQLAEAEREAVWEGVTDTLEAAGVDWARVDLRGYPSSAIAQYAEEVDAALIVVGTRGRGGFSSLILGSTSQGLIHEANVDVLVVKSPAT